MKGGAGAGQARGLKWLPGSRPRVSDPHAMSSVPSTESLAPGPMMGITGDVGGAHGAGAGLLRGPNRFGGPDFFMALLARGGAAVILLMLAALIFVLTRAAIPSIRDYGAKFLATSSWRPNELEIDKRDANGNLVLDSDGERVKV